MASCVLLFFFSSRRRHTRYIGDWSSDVCSSDLEFLALDIEDLVVVDRVIPVNNDKILDVECKEFADAVDRVSTISTERSRAVKLALDRGNLVVSATSPENGTAVEELEVRYQNSPIEIGFNSRYQIGRASCRERVS